MVVAGAIAGLRGVEDVVGGVDVDLVHHRLLEGPPLLCADVWTTLIRLRSVLLQVILERGTPSPLPIRCQAVLGVSQRRTSQVAHAGIGADPSPSNHQFPSQPCRTLPLQIVLVIHL